MLCFTPFGVIDAAEIFQTLCQWRRWYDVVYRKSTNVLIGGNFVDFTLKIAHICFLLLFFTWQFDFILSSYKASGNHPASSWVFLFHILNTGEKNSCEYTSWSDSWKIYNVLGDKIQILICGTLTIYLQHAVNLHHNCPYDKQWMYIKLINKEELMTRTLSITAGP